MNHNEKHWSDQPDQVLRGQLVLSIFYNGRGIEVRACPDGTFYVTTGNLFGSQTLECQSIGQVFAVLQLASDVKQGKTAGLPKGARLLEPQG